MPAPLPGRYAFIMPQGVGHPQLAQIQPFTDAKNSKSAKYIFQLHTRPNSIFFSAKKMRLFIRNDPNIIFKKNSGK